LLRLQGSNTRLEANIEGASVLVDGTATLGRPGVATILSGATLEIGDGASVDVPFDDVAATQLLAKNGARISTDGGAFSCARPVEIVDSSVTLLGVTFASTAEIVALDTDDADDFGVQLSFDDAVLPALTARGTGGNRLVSISGVQRIGRLTLDGTDLASEGTITVGDVRTGSNAVRGELNVTGTIGGTVERLLVDNTSMTLDPTLPVSVTELVVAPGSTLDLGGATVDVGTAIVDGVITASTFSTLQVDNLDLQGTGALQLPTGVLEIAGRLHVTTPTASTLGDEHTLIIRSDTIITTGGGDMSIGDLRVLPGATLTIELPLLRCDEVTADGPVLGPISFTRCAGTGCPTA
ncbi:MAG TPA: hypothetical protein VGF99_13890, partial [Myxococcota bacterium]